MAMIRYEWAIKAREAIHVKRLCVSLASVLAAMSCASPGPLNRAALRASQPRTILATLPPIPAFRGRTSTIAGATAPLALLGMAVGSELEVSEGKKARAKHLYDPADAISAALMKGMVRRFSLNVVDAGKQETLGTSAGELSREYKDVDLVLDVRTSDWGFVPIRMGHYGILYEGTLRLIDTRNQSVIAEGSCTFHPADSEDSPSYDELMAADAALLKARFRALTQFCADDYRTRILGLYGQ
jgi:hypothetical protein